MSYCEFKLAKANTEEELKKAIHEAGKEGWYRTGPNRTNGERTPTSVQYYCVLSRMLPAATISGDRSVLSFVNARRDDFWRGDRDQAAGA